ncbi:C-C chemokine receptor type 9 [Lampris incognitus]|uniref:C-C chemokine receptor type 9 n=1 Tax=Lampris incognitus TaxID=2546036 RepID=UPI0024B59E0C|nr:C-C chemokine receptor type 9 [Lampris incognitus]
MAALLPSPGSTPHNNSATETSGLWAQPLDEQVYFFTGSKTKVCNGTLKDKMDFQFLINVTAGSPTDETDTGSGFTEDYVTYSVDNSGMCDKSRVRYFRRYYEPPLFYIIFVLGALGNLMVVGIYATIRNRLKTMTDVYLLNLAVADLLFLGTLPIWATDAKQGWAFGTGTCKVVSAMYKINFFSSMLLLTCISVDRYIAIVQVAKAHNTKNKRRSYSRLVCLGVWVTSALLALPEFIFATQKNDLQNQSFCVLVYWNNWNNRTKIIVLSLQICMGFCLPLVVMGLCYSIIIRTLLQARCFEKHKALRVILVSAAVFVLSQLPYNGLLVIEALQAANTTITECDTVKHFDIAGQIAKSLAYTHACLNPVLYVFLGVRLRNDFFKMLRWFTYCFGKGGCSEAQAVPKPSSVMSDTETMPTLSL